ncbi:MAG TPA: hypothetical protein PKL48_12050 [Thermodesulfobacteriota bacterium]|nr:hypothetical protein [Thermodesulfobacteriota bacterium]
MPDEVFNIEILGEKYATRKNLAGAIGLEQQTLACWAVLRKGPPMIRIGKRRLYPQSGFRKWLERQTVSTGVEQ